VECLLGHVFVGMDQWGIADSAWENYYVFACV